MAYRALGVTSRPGSRGFGRTEREIHRRLRDRLEGEGIRICGPEWDLLHEFWQLDHLEQAGAEDDYLADAEGAAREYARFRAAVLQINKPASSFSPPANRQRGQRGITSRGTYLRHAAQRLLFADYVDAHAEFAALISGGSWVSTGSLFWRVLADDYGEWVADSAAARQRYHERLLSSVEPRHVLRARRCLGVLDINPKPRSPETLRRSYRRTVEQRQTLVEEVLPWLNVQSNALEELYRALPLSSDERTALWLQAATPHRPCWFAGMFVYANLSEKERAEPRYIPGCDEVIRVMLGLRTPEVSGTDGKDSAGPSQNAAEGDRTANRVTHESCALGGSARACSGRF